jgi:hypothetical protein
MIRFFRILFGHRTNYLVRKMSAYVVARSKARESGHRWTTRDEKVFNVDWASADAYWGVR